MLLDGRVADKCRKPRSRPSVERTQRTLDTSRCLAHTLPTGILIGFACAHHGKHARHRIGRCATLGIEATWVRPRIECDGYSWANSKIYKRARLADKKGARLASEPRAPRESTKRSRRAIQVDAHTGDRFNGCRAFELEDSGISIAPTFKTMAAQQPAHGMKELIAGTKA